MSDNISVWSITRYFFLTLHLILNIDLLKYTADILFNCQRGLNMNIVGIILIRFLILFIVCYFFIFAFSVIIFVVLKWSVNEINNYCTAKQLILIRCRLIYTCTSKILFFKIKINLQFQLFELRVTLLGLIRISAGYGSLEELKTDPESLAVLQS